MQTNKSQQRLFAAITIILMFLYNYVARASERGISVRNSRYIELQLRVEKCIPKMLDQQFGFGQAKAICIDIVRSQTLTLKDKKILDKLEEF